MEQIGISDFETNATQGIKITDIDTLLLLREILNKPAGKVDSLSGWYSKYND